MKKKIKESIGAKTFLTMFLLLLVCCILIYGMVMVFLPKNYHIELQNQFTTDFYTLAESLEKNGWEDISQDILAFSIRNNAFVRIEDDAGNEMLAVNISNDEKENRDAKALSSSGSFTYKGKTYHLLATANLIAVTQSYDILVKLIPFIAGMILLISVIAAYVCSCYFSKPLIHICGVAKRMARLDMTWKCDESRSDEIGQLAGSLNEMSAQLSQALESLESANEQLQSDIEKERRQERQRIDFFTSVSHELKTPITIIKGELEGMIYKIGEYKNRDAYLKHALKTVTDMEMLVKDILFVARMGGSDFQLLREKVDMTRLVQRCCRKVKGISEDKRIKLFLHLQQNIFYHGDERLLQQAVSNIINNAVIYSPEQAEVEVELSDTMLTVYNTGIYIKDEDLEQLFIPFFRVDKSHSRNTGGSGLGLYIVKTIFDCHNISYKLENTEKGVKFTVNF